MKTLTTISASALVLGAVLLAGCNANTADETSGFPITVKDIPVSDASGATSAMVTVSSDNPAAIEDLDSSSFVLVPISAEASKAETPEGLLANADDASEEQVAADDDEPAFQIAVNKEVLGEGVTGFELQQVMLPSYRAKFTWRHHYSGVKSDRDGNLYAGWHCASVTRDSWLHKIYASAYSQSALDGDWNTHFSNVKIANGDTRQACTSALAWQFKLSVRARKTKHYSVDFSE